MATGKPDLTRIWAESAPASNVVDPDNTTAGKFSAGWLAEIPPFQHRNFIEKQVTQGLAHVNEQGICVWDNLTTYPAGAIVKGSNGAIYSALSENTDENPASATDDWMLSGPSLVLENVSDIEKLTQNSMYNGARVFLKSWNPGDNRGGGFFIYDQSTAKSKHDGGKHLSLTVPWSIVIADYLNAVGETDPLGTGCLVRENVRTACPLMFGANALRIDQYADPLDPQPSEIFDDTASLQKCWDADWAIEIDHSAVPYWFVSNLTIPNKLFLQLKGRSSIEAINSGDSYYLAASYNHLNNIPEAGLPITISDKLRFNARTFKDHSLIIQSWNVVLHVETMYANSDGFVYSAETRNGSTFPTSSMVNPRILIESRNNGGDGVRVRDSLRNNATDGYILPGSTCHDNGGNAINIDSGAGWDVVGNFYANGDRSIRFNAVGKGTRVHHAFLDDDFSLYINTHINYGIMRIDNCDIAGVVETSGNSNVVGGVVGIKSVSNHYRNANAYIRHNWFGSDRAMFSYNDTFENQTDPFRFHNGSSTGRFRVVDALITDTGELTSALFDATTKSIHLLHSRPSSSHKGETYRDRSSGISAGGAFSFDFEIFGLGSFSQRAGVLNIVTRQFNTGATRVLYSANVVISSKNNATNPWVVNLMPVIETPGQWTTSVSASVMSAADNTGTLTIAGDPSDSDGYGNVHLIWG